MKYSKLTLFFLFFLTNFGFSQVFPHKDYPEVLYAVQTRNIFEDSKSFPDCIPLISPNKIDSCFNAEILISGFNLQDFVDTYFYKPIKSPSAFSSDTSLELTEYINVLWKELTTFIEHDTGSLIALPFPYVVPGGRFREMHYWNTYFTMLGLAHSDKIELIENLVNNFAWLIDTFGFVPNGNRTYYLSRSQPPFFSLMVELLAGLKGDSILPEYLPQLEKEYAFWMNGFHHLSEENNAIRRVVLLEDGSILNRYWDNMATPRAEAFIEDITYAKYSPLPDSVDYRNIRATCESGWDFSSRWIKNETILETTEILPVDLNCLLYNLESTISKAYRILNDKRNAKRFERLSKDRKKAINKYFWRKDAGYYVDYHHNLKLQKPAEHLAGVYPLYFEIASKSQAKNAAEFIHQNLLMPGGLVTTINTSGKQWDAPNGWAPLQFISIEGLYNYGQIALADTICKKWIDLNTKSYKNTGKLVEKYNVVNPQLAGGDQEYSIQDAFGWTNGVLLYLLSKK